MKGEVEKGDKRVVEGGGNGNGGLRESPTPFSRETATGLPKRIGD